MEDYTIKISAVEAKLWLSLVGKEQDRIARSRRYTGFERAACLAAADSLARKLSEIASNQMLPDPAKEVPHD